MNAAILCPGPSLTQTWDDDFSGLTIAVNRAATRFRCDVWAAMDFPLVWEETGNIQGKPDLYTIKATAESLLRRGHREARYIAEDLFDFCPARFGWTLFTACASLVLAAKLGATRISVYGADWSNAADFDGIWGGQNRSCDRWVRESGIWNLLAGWLNGRGVAIEMINGKHP